MSRIHRVILNLMVGFVTLIAFCSTSFAKTDLLVYTAVEADELAMFKEEFEADYPDVNIKWVRDSTGIVTAKLLAEKDNPQADIVWGLAATSLVLLANEGYFQGYTPAGVGELDGIDALVEADGLGDGGGADAGDAPEIEQHGVVYLQLHAAFAGDLKGVIAA